MLNIKNMRNIIVLAILLSLPCALHAQNLSGVVASTRTVDWSNAGVTGGIPATRPICTTGTGTSPIAAYTGTAATINTALSGCDANHAVILAAGTFNLSDSVCFRDSNRSLRGQGMSTIINFTGHSGCTQTWQGSGVPPLFNIQGFVDTSGYNSPPGFMGFATANKANWTGTNNTNSVYTQGATVITLSNTANLGVGSTITLWQSDPASSTVPSTGFYISADTTNDPTAVAWQGDNAVQGAGVIQRSRVVSISGTQVTITPGIFLPAGTWTSSLTPKAGWPTSGNEIHGIGLENFYTARSGAGVDGMDFYIGFETAYDCWVTGVGISPDPSLGGNYVIGMQDTRNMTIRSNWIDPAGGGNQSVGTTFAVYGIAIVQSSSVLVENNIVNGVYAPLVVSGGTSGNVYAYNYDNHVIGEGGVQFHEEGEQMILVEGNSIWKVWADVFHGNGVFNTIFRNFLQNTGYTGIDLWASHRWFNIIGNVFSNSVLYKSLSSDGTHYSRYCDVAIRLGYATQYGDDPPCTGTGPYPSGGFNPVDPPALVFGEVHPDTRVETSTMLWGNYAIGANHFVNGEVPTGDALFPNSVPASQTLPNSAYLSLSPTWWPTGKHWPLMGPDVTGGAYQSGHAYSTPAQDCFNSAAGVITSFNPSSCYDGGGAGQGGTCTPDHLTVTSQPGSAVLGASLGSISIAVQDSGNNTCTSQTDTITISKHSATCTGMTLNGTVSGSEVSGVFTTSNINMTVATGSCSLDATDGTRSVTTSSFTISVPFVPGTGARFHLRPDF